MRHAPAALVAALLVATGLSFLYVESLKLEPSPIRGTRVNWAAGTANGKVRLTPRR